MLICVLFVNKYSYVKMVRIDYSPVDYHAIPREIRTGPKTNQPKQ